MLNHRKACIFNSLLKVYYRSVFNESSKAFIFHSSKSCWKFTSWVTFYFGLSLQICLWKMRATPGACIKPGCLAWRPLCYKVNLPASCEARRALCHKVNLPSCVARRPLFHKVILPRCEAWRRHFIMTCVIFGTRQTNILAPCYLFGKTWPALSSATQVTEINIHDQITGKPHTHSSEGVNDSLETCEIETCSVLREPTVFKHNYCAPAFTTKNVVLGRSLYHHKLRRLASNGFIL